MYVNMQTHTHKFPLYIDTQNPSQAPNTILAFPIRLTLPLLTPTEAPVHLREDTPHYSCQDAVTDTAPPIQIIKSIHDP